jgi:hypothetical protein
MHDFDPVFVGVPFDYQILYIKQYGFILTHFDYSFRPDDR